MNATEIVAVTSRSFSKNKFLVGELKKKYSNVILNETGKTLRDDSLIEFLKSADKVIIGIEDLSAANLSKLSNLRVISKYGVGLNNIDLDFCKANGIKLGFVPGVNKQSVAELTLTLILIGLKKIHQNHFEIRQGEWPQTKGYELKGKTVGILGFGNIGQTLAQLLSPFQCKINFFDVRNFQIDELDNFCLKNHIDIKNINQKSMNDVLVESDIISIHLPLNDETEDMINADVLSKLKPSAVIVNTARGGIVVEEDLANFLRIYDDSFAAFDVFKEEPVINNNLFNLKNFFGTSHRSSLTYEGINSMGMSAIKGLDDNIEIK